MKVVRTLVALTSAVLLLLVPPLIAPPSAEAYDVFLTQWNTNELEAAGDQVKVTIFGNTITFLWIDGDGIAPTATNLKELFWKNNVVAEGGSAGTGTGDYTSIQDGGTDAGGSQADGFGKFRVKVADADEPNNKTTGPLSFTFTNSFTDLGSTILTAADFALHVQYTNSCSGFVGGTNAGSSSNGNCTPIPEPITMFLGGTGLLILGYVARKRLFGGRLAS